MSSNLSRTLVSMAMLALLLLWSYTNIPHNMDFLEQEAQFKKGFFLQTIDLKGTILDETGDPLAGAELTLQGETASTTSNGSFSFVGINRTNSLLVIKAKGFRTEFIPVHLHIPLNVSSEVLEPIPMISYEPQKTRFLFGGDTHFGRRFLDPLETTPRDQIPADNTSALIQASNPEPGTRQAVEHILPFFREADFSVVNFESSIVDNVSTPNREKDYILFTLTDSLSALKWLGVDYVSLGNNHVYDYLEQGINDTILNLGRYGIPNSGAGSNASEAFKTFRVTLNGTSYSFLSMNSIVYAAKNRDGFQSNITFVANSTKAGSANLQNSSAVASAIRNEIAMRYIPIVQIHGGNEYTYEPSDYMRGRIDLVTRNGAGLVVSHHPHVAQGVGINHDILVLEGLGNLVFDAERLETMIGLLARVDMNGDKVSSVRLIPAYIDNYSPRPISGRLSSLFLRRIAEFSRHSPYPVYPYNSQGWVALGKNETAIKDRTIQINIKVPDSGTMILDLRQLARDGESLAEAKSDSENAYAQVGRDIMMFGDFEDWDIDEDNGETDHWDLSGNSSLLSLSKPYKGIASLCSIRNAYSKNDSVIPFRNRIRVMGDALGEVPNKNLSIIGYIHGDGAGPIKIMARYLASEGEMTFGDEEILSHPGGTFSWQPFACDIHMPLDDPSNPRDPTTDPRALRIFIHQSAPEKGIGIAQFDEIAVINWEETIDLTQGSKLATPHARDFLRISSSPGIHPLTLRFQSFKPSIVESR